MALEKDVRSLLTTFIQHAAHEFRTPLSAISSSSYLMLRTRSEDQRERKAGQIE
ncbi:HAMP domain-containing histidine kinase, partial [bacterium]|nr:HAMP domain-containing histidine kinase [bacterium]